jgi:hypothetical protein
MYLYIIQIYVKAKANLITVHTEQGAHEYIIFKESLLTNLHKRLPEGIFEPYYQLEWLHWLESCPGGVRH